jgi:hypothetical protein
MVRLIAAVMLSSLPFAQLSFADAKSDQVAARQFASNTDGTSGDLPSLPPAPRGKSTVIGGSIRDVDPVLDRLTLNVAGSDHTMKILFDERTRVYRDGVKTSLRDLRPNDHASVETVLDGTSVFALSIHMLSHSPEGECQGQVLSYNPATGELTVNDILSHEPVKLRVRPGTTVTREGQTNFSGPASSSDLVNGTLVSIKFKPDNQGHGIADKLAILATPGAAFVFNGNVAFLDLHSNLLVVTDPRTDTKYSISFDPARFPEAGSLHEGAHVRVTAKFDGSRYVASAITAE